MGLVRGKTDKMDAQRICSYAYRHQDKAKLYSDKEEGLDDLSDLLSTRERLLKAKQILTVPLNEMRQVGLSKQAQSLESSCQESIASLSKEIKAIDSQIDLLVEEEKEIKSNYQLALSVKGIGKLTALYLIVYSGNFKRFSSAKKLASYAGVAPFAYSSGTSVRGRTRVHAMANKQLKKLLYMCALATVGAQGNMHAYYRKKVNEGKHKMSVINAIKNKLLARVYACVRDQKMYSYKQAA
jgi:transposase